MSEAQGVNVASLYENGLVEHIVDERPDAALEGRAFCQRLAQAIEYELAELSSADISGLLPRRLDKYHRLGRIPATA
jgi:acetyl-CoA carboxylase carboxyl transferase subunit beta